MRFAPGTVPKSFAYIHLLFPTALEGGQSYQSQLIGGAQRAEASQLLQSVGLGFESSSLAPGHALEFHSMLKGIQAQGLFRAQGAFQEA